MRRSRVLALVGGTVGFAVVHTRALRSRATPPDGREKLPPAHGARTVRWAIPTVAVLLRPAIDMPDLPSIFLDFWNLGNLIWDQISSIVLSILEKAWKLLGDVINDALHMIDEIFETVWGAFDYVYDQIRPLTNALAHVIQQTWDGVEAAFANFRQQLTGWLENGYNLISDYVLDKIPDLIRSLLGDAWDFLQALIGIGVDGIGVLLDFVTDPVGFIWGLIKGLVEDAINVLAVPFDFIVSEGLRILFAGYGDVIDVLKKVWSFLVWIAEHIDELDPTKLDDIFDVSLESIAARIERAVDDNSPTFEKLIAGWL